MGEHWTTRWRRWRARRALRVLAERMRADDMLVHGMVAAGWRGAWGALRGGVLSARGKVTLALWPGRRDVPPVAHWSLPADEAVALGIQLIAEGMRADEGALKRVLDAEHLAHIEDRARRMVAEEEDRLRARRAET